ncbi:hypothetical protein LZ30DRAFT_701515 [Colletotrichum cereale]|nr:hypothetical protein LZ30DRAFT_701515 [Colletotrichum cereale]
MIRHLGDATTAVPPPKSSPQTVPRKAARLYPALSLLSVILVFLSAAAGVTLSAIALFHNLESSEVLDPLSRAVFFVASCVSLVYVLTHLVAARITYIKNLGSPTAYGKYVTGFAFLLARLGLPVWVAAITLAIFVAVNVGLDLSKGVKQNLPWLNVIISIASLFSLSAVLVVIEMADRPFATLGFSPPWFIRADDTSAYSREDDLGSSIVEAAASIFEKREKEYERDESLGNQERRKRKTLTKSNPREAQQRVSRHTRSMSMPTPLNTVFSDRSSVFTPASPAFHSAFAWRPPTRAGSTPKADGTAPIHSWVTWQEHGYLRQAASDISTNASARPNEVILPSLLRHTEYSPRSQALLEQQGEYDARRWTAIGMQSPPFTGGFPVASFQRPLTPLMTMEEENRIMSCGPAARDGDSEANHHLRIMQDNRPARSHSIATLTASKFGSTAGGEPVAPFQHTATAAEGRARRLRSDNDVLPNEGRRRRRISSDEPNDSRRLTYGTESQVDSYHTLRLSTRPTSQHDPTSNTYAPTQRPVSQTSTVRSVGSNVYNFSRPRTSAAARMQIKVARRLRAMKQRDSSSSVQRQTDEQMPTPPSTPGSPDTPRIIRDAAVRNLQDKLGRRKRIEQEDICRRPPSPETPRTARATAVKNLQERLGKRMMRHNGVEASNIAP